MLLKLREAPILRAHAQPCANLAEGLRIGQDMQKWMRKYNKIHTIKGVGLSAPQVGISKAVCITGYGNKWKIYVNPVIIERASDTEVLSEGCLSLPGYSISIARPKWVVIKTMNLETFKAEGMFGRILQHELDHLNGILISDYEPRKVIAHVTNDKESVPVS